MFANVNGVPAEAPDFGLIASAVPVDNPEEHWEDGFSWVPERCAITYQALPRCADPAGYIPPTTITAAYHRPIAFRFGDRATTMGGLPVTERADRIRRLAEAQSSFALARELWTGAKSAADPYTPQFTGGATVNDALASANATVVVGSAATVQRALGRLEAAALEASGGQQITMHIPITLLPQMQSYLTKDDRNILHTMAGNVVISDGGYPGTGPSNQPVGSTAWAYATAPVQVRLSAIDVQDDNSTVDYATNTRTLYAVRVMAATFDPCVHLATEITL